MPFHLAFFSLPLILIAFVFGEESLLTDGLFEPFDEWTLEPAIGLDLDLGLDLDPLTWNLDGDQSTLDTNFNLASLPVDEESSADFFWASCPLGGIGARDEQLLCPAPLSKEEVPTLPTFEDIQNAVGNTGIATGSEPERKPGPKTQIVPFYRTDSKCPPTHPHYLCCICDDNFALEVCQDCFLCKLPSPFVSLSTVSHTWALLGVGWGQTGIFNDAKPNEHCCIDGGLCRRPHIQVCCMRYGREPVRPLPLSLSLRSKAVHSRLPRC